MPSRSAWASWHGWEAVLSNGCNDNRLIIVRQRKEPMRLLGLCLFSTVVFSLMNCKKQTQENTSAGKGIHLDSLTAIPWKQCSPLDSNNDAVRICFDSLLEDSRCPEEVVCFWQGTAVAKFLFSVSNVEHAVTLSTFDLPGVYRSDTILMGYKIKLVDVRPYPHANVQRPVSDLEAYLRITKQ